MNIKFGITSKDHRRLMSWLAVLVLAVSAVSDARAQEFPREIFEPYGVPTIEGARVLKTRIEKGKRMYAVAYDATFEQVMQWLDKMVAKAIYKACAANASAIEPLGSSSEIATTHWWTYTYRGVSYQAYVTADLDHLGRFEFTARRQ